MELLDFDVMSSSSSFRLVVIYRPPPNCKNRHTSSMFLDEFSTIMETTSSVNRLLLAGDFNVHVDVADNKEASSFLNMLELYGLQQHVSGPTYSGNHTLDLLISRRDETFVTSPSIHHDLPSDHAVVKCQLNIGRPPPCSKSISSRKIRDIDMDEFCNDITTSTLYSSPAGTDLDSLVEVFNDKLTSILDEHAPVIDRSVTLRPHAPWYTDRLRAAKQERRQCERSWMKSNLTVDKESYKEKCIQYTNLLVSSKSEFHCNQIAGANQRDLFRAIEKLSSPHATKVLPTHDCRNKLADKYAGFSATKSASFGMDFSLYLPSTQQSYHLRHARARLVNSSRSLKLRCCGQLNLPPLHLVH